MKPENGVVCDGDTLVVAVSVQRDPVVSLVPGDCVGGYDIGHKLGAGGCGSVYYGTHRTLGRPVAIKLMSMECAQAPEMLVRFEREAQTLSQIAHPNIVQVHEVGTTSTGRPFFVMELLSGLNLQQLLVQEGRLTLAEAVKLLGPVCDALQAAHDIGIVHRDVKAANVMLVRHGDGQVVKLLDFGIAKLLSPDPSQPGLTTKGNPIGTVYAMPPEQIRGEEVDGRADVYALGVLTFQLLTGRLPFVASTPRGLMASHLYDRPPRPSEVVPLPLSVDRVVLRALEKARDARFASTTEFYEALRACLPDQNAGHGVAQALEVTIGIRRAQSSVSEDDDELDTMLAGLMETAESMLECEDWHVDLSTDTALVASLSLPANDTAEGQARDLAVRFCEQMSETLRTQAGVGMELELTVRERGGGHGQPRVLLSRTSR